MTMDRLRITASNDAGFFVALKLVNESVDFSGEGVYTKRVNESVDHLEIRGETTMTEITQSATKNFTDTRDNKEIPVTATFNGKVYNDKRYITVKYRLNNTRSGIKQFTAIWQDGFGWTDCRAYGDELIQLFDLK